MNERIHRVLDGELEEAVLTAAERRVLAEYRTAIAGASAAMPRVGAPDLSARVQARIRAEAVDGAAAGGAPAPAAAAPDGREAATSGPAAGSSGSLARAWKWLWAPHTVRLRPAYALGLAALLALLVPLAGDGPSPFPVQPGTRADAPGTVPAAEAIDAPQPEVYVHFRLDAPDASSVRLAGDFTGWQPEHELHEVAPGVWTTVVPVRPGVHDYAFVVDGEQWRPDPLAMQVDDGFGGTNSRLSILPPERGRV